MRPLALIDSDPIAMKQLQTTFEAAGFRVDCFDDPWSAVRSAPGRGFSVALLSITPRVPDPIPGCRELSLLMPVITLVSECSEDICVSVLEAGAGDCLRRPVTERELVARVRNLVRRVDGHEEPDGGQAISLSEMRVRSSDERVHDLSRGEAEVLAVFVRYAPSPLTVAQVAALFPDVKPGTIESRIKSLRLKIGKDRLLSRGRFGYQLE